MLDFIYISKKFEKGSWIITPNFLVQNSTDLMIRGQDFYAIWDAQQLRWSTSESDAVRIMDNELDAYVKENESSLNGCQVNIKYARIAESGTIDRWHKYCRKQMWDNFHTLDDKVIFSNMEPKKEDFSSKRLSYPLLEGPTDNFDTLMNVLYSEEELRKIMWAIGAIVSGDSKRIQKFCVLYGAAGTGKSTILNIIQKLFDGYYSVFDAKSLGDDKNRFSLESFRTNPLVGIQHDGDLSHIEDNTKINSLVSHEKMAVDTKNKSIYVDSFNTFLFMGTNRPVKITDAKSGLLRRLIDISPTGVKVGANEYKKLMRGIEFELGGIAYKCLEFYLNNKDLYDHYVPISMLGASNNFYNYIVDNYFEFSKEPYITLQYSWDLYKKYCEDAKIAYPMNKMTFKEELKNYFNEFVDRYTTPEGERLRSVYVGFKESQFQSNVDEKHPLQKYELTFNKTESIFDSLYSTAQAQYAKEDETPMYSWSKVNTTLGDLNTNKLHYILLPETNHIVIDFDLKDRHGNKSFELNLQAAAKFPPTYAELSKSGAGIHLHYIYDGDVTQLESLYSKDIEIKVFKGKSALRRRVSRCNDTPIAHISSGLPLKKEVPKTINEKKIKSDIGVRNMILRNLNKEIHGSTKCSINFIDTILNDAYNDGISYDVRDLTQKLLAFASHSTNNSKYCISKVLAMKLCSKDMLDNGAVDNEKIESDSNKPIAIFDLEVYPNLFVVCWSMLDNDEVYSLINPTPDETKNLLNYRLIGYNNRRYDNHILYAAIAGYSNMELYKLSKKIIGKTDKNCFFPGAYSLSYTDIFDYCTKKQSLKKWEIELGIHHQEMSISWDEPVPEELWPAVVEYCKNDVIATKAVYDKTQADFLARQILADLTGMTVNDTTNTLTGALIFGNNKSPQNEFNYRDLSKPVTYSDELAVKYGRTEFRIFDQFGEPTYETYKPGDVLPEGYSVLPFFPEYMFDGKYSKFDNFDINEGGLVLAEEGYHILVDLLDIMSMHPHSAIAECIFGPKYTKIFEDLVHLRIAVKHRDFDVISKFMNGALMKYADDSDMMDALAYALKIAINSVYGLTAASFVNVFKDPNNKDNIVAKRGALFMFKLATQVRKRGYTVAHVKTDSIKIPNADNDIIEFCKSYAKEFGYTFEHEARYGKMCLVNKAVYIAKYETAENCEKALGYIPGDNAKHGGQWTATGTQFAVPYVHKKLFTQEPITFEDLCEIKSVTSALYLDFNENLTDVSAEEEELARRTSVVQKKLNPLYSNMSNEDLEAAINKGHNYIFVGRVGNFCPIRKGMGGGRLVREKDGKYYNVSNTTGYRFKEAEIVNGDLAQIDMSYFNTLAQDAFNEISKWTDARVFCEQENLFI